MAALLDFEPPESGRVPDAQLLSEMSYYLNRHAWSEYGYYQKLTFEQKLQQIENGNAIKALYAQFDPTQYYFVCGYYAEPGEDEWRFYSNVYSYVWFAFDDANDIPETYRECELIAVVQVNKAGQCRNLLDESKTPQLENYRLLDLPTFENGKCICEPAEVNDALIFISEYEERQYSCIEYQLHDIYDIPCIELDGQMYIPIKEYTISADGTRYDVDLRSELGKYYDAIMAVLISDRYSATNAKGYEAHYAVLKLEDFFALFGD